MEDDDADLNFLNPDRFAVAVILTNAFLAYRGRAKGSMKMLILSILAAGATIAAAVQNEASVHFLRAIVGG